MFSKFVCIYVINFVVITYSVVQFSFISVVIVSINMFRSFVNFVLCPYSRQVINLEVSNFYWSINYVLIYECSNLLYSKNIDGVTFWAWRLKMLKTPKLTLVPVAYSEIVC